MVHQFLAGVAGVEITPPVGLPMVGYVARVGVRSGVHDSLLAQILVLEVDQMRMALVTLDVLGVSAGFSDRLRRSLAAVLSTDSNAILICASHTHAGPSGLQNWIATRATNVLDSQLMGQIEAQLVIAARN